MPIARLRVTRTVLDSLAFSGIWTAFAAATLIGASGVFLQRPWGPAQLDLACGLGFAGTMTVYAFDRVRDIQRDQASSPSRSAFVARHRRALVGVSAAGLSLSLAAAWALPPVTWLLCAGVGAMGLLHRRLKNRSPSAWVYVSAAWVGITVGLPALIVAPDPISLSALLTLTLCWALAIGSNALASELRGLLYDAQAATQPNGAVAAPARAVAAAAGGRAGVRIIHRAQHHRAETVVHVEAFAPRPAAAQSRVELTQCLMG